MNAAEAREKTKANSDKVKRFGAETYIKYINGKIDRRTEDGRTFVMDVYENMKIERPSKEVAAEIIKHFQDNGYRVEYFDKDNFIKRISWEE